MKIIWNCHLQPTLLLFMSNSPPPRLVFWGPSRLPGVYIFNKKIISSPPFWKTFSPSESTYACTERKHFKRVLSLNWKKMLSESIKKYQTIRKVACWCPIFHFPSPLTLIIRDHPPHSERYKHPPPLSTYCRSRLV